MTGLLIVLNNTAPSLVTWLTQEFTCDVMQVTAGKSDIGKQLGELVGPTLLVRLDRDHLQIAKWKGNGLQICPICLDLRIKALERRDELASVAKANALTDILTPFSREAISSLLRVVDSDADPIGYDLHLLTLRWTHFAVEPHPACFLCARPRKDRGSLEATRLRPRSKQDVKQYRLTDACDMRFPLQHYINRTCGMLGAHLHKNRYHPFLAQVGGHFREGRLGRHEIQWRGSTLSYGRSVRVGICEAFERYAAVKSRGYVETVYDCFRNVRDHAVDPRDFGTYEEDQHDLKRFSDNAAIRWTWGYSVTEDRLLLVPLQMAYYGLHFDDEPRFVYDSSNGCATGSCLEEALLFALLELIERDTFLIHWLACLSPRQIDLETVHDLRLRCLIDRIRRADLKAYLLDSRLDVPVPSIMAVVTRSDRQLGSFSLASGCSFDPEQAMLAALSEAAGYHVGFQGRTRSSEAKLRLALADFRQVKRMKDHGSLFGLPEAADYAQFLISNKHLHSVDTAYENWEGSAPHTLDLLDDVRHCLDLLTAASLRQVVVVDQTTPEEERVGLRSVRALVPGLMPMDWGYGRCRAASLPRLYSVPVLLGMRKAPFDSRYINRTPHPLA